MPLSVGVFLLRHLEDVGVLTSRTSTTEADLSARFAQTVLAGELPGSTARPLHHEGPAHLKVRSSAKAEAHNRPPHPVHGSNDVRDLRWFAEVRSQHPA